MDGSPSLERKDDYGGGHQTEQSTSGVCLVNEESEEEETTQTTAEEPEEIDELIPERLDVAACEEEGQSGTCHADCNRRDAASKEDFYNIANDPYELNNIIGSKDPDILKEINRLREFYLEQENHIFNYHLSQLEKNIQSELKIKFPNDAKKHSIKKVIITFNALTPIAVAESLIKNLKKYFINIKINLLIQRKLKSKYDNIGVFIHTGICVSCIINSFCTRHDRDFSSSC